MVPPDPRAQSIIFPSFHGLKVGVFHDFFHNFYNIVGYLFHSMISYSAILLYPKSIQISFNPHAETYPFAVCKEVSRGKSPFNIPFE
jgi:hypothetical protein